MTSCRLTCSRFGANIIPVLHVLPCGSSGNRTAKTTRWVDSCDSQAMRLCHQTDDIFSLAICHDIFHSSEQASFSRSCSCKQRAGSILYQRGAHWVSSETKHYPHLSTGQQMQSMGITWLPHVTEDKALSLQIIVLENKRVMNKECWRLRFHDGCQGSPGSLRLQM